MGLTATLSSPFFAGASSSQEVPGRYHVSLNGRPYMIDMARLDEFTRRSIPLLRNQANTGDQFGEASLNPEELWRSSQDSWDHGAGQAFLDREESDRRRFRSSKGVDVWTHWQLSLLPDTSSKRASANTNLYLIPVGDRLYLTDGTALLHTASLAGTPSWTTVTGTPSAAVALASDGFNVWTAHGSSGVYKTTRGGASATSYATGTVTALGYVKGRLMAAGGNSIYNIIATGALPAALFTHGNSDFTWVGFAEGSAVIYAAGYSGDKSLIYRTSIKPDGTSLDAPVVAGELPDGEIVRSIQGYLGYVLLGTDKGVRFCSADANGSLTVGALIRTTNPVLCFEGQDKFAWFGWTNYDSASTGLGRLDLQTFTFSLTPAYASDLMASGQGTVQSVVTFGDKRVFSVAGLGVFQESTNKVPTGTLDTGLITYGMSDEKVAVYLDVRLANTVGANAAHLSVDGRAFISLGTRSSANSSAFAAGQQIGETFEVRHELTRSATDPTTGPIITRQTLRSYPKPSSGEVFTVPVKLHENLLDLNDNTCSLNPQVELDLHQSLRQTRALVTYQMGNQSYVVLVDDYAFMPHSPTADRTAWNGTNLLRLKRLAD